MTTTDVSNNVEQQEEESTPIIAFQDLPNESIEGIFNYCDVQTLCNLDVTCNSFQNRTDVVWERMAFERFGISKSLHHFARSTETNPKTRTGKDIWKKGLALIKNNSSPSSTAHHHHPVVVSLAQPAEFHTRTHQEEDEDYFVAYENVVTNTSSSIIAYSINNFVGGTYEALTGSYPIFIRDSNSLSYTRRYSHPSNFHGMNHALCGPAGCEILVTATAKFMIAQRGGKSQHIFLSMYDHGDVIFPFHERTGYGIEIIGNQNHLIVIGGGALYVFQPSMMMDDSLLSFKGSFPYINETMDEGTTPSLTWACSELPNIFGFFPRPNFVTVWKLNDTATEEHYGNNWKPIELQTFTTGNSNLFRIAIGERYIACAEWEEGNTHSYRFHVYKRETKTEMHILQDEDHNQLNIPDGEYYHPASMEFVGDLLVSTSLLGNALCIWDVKTGTLLKRHEQAFAQRINRPLTEDSWGNEVTGMVRLHDTDYMGFITSTTSSLCLWAFPYDWQGQSMAEHLAGREKKFHEYNESVVHEDDDEDSNMSS